MRVIFLDVDGVLNGWNKHWEAIYWLDSHSKYIGKFIRKYMLDIIDIYGIHKKKVRILSKICKKTNAVCVMSSSWRGAYFSKNKKYETDRLGKLKRLVKKYHIEIIDKTGTVSYPEDYYMERTLEIKQWLEDHKDEVDSFVILDDENVKGLEKYLVKTSDKVGEFSNHNYEGLNRHHIKEVINKFKIQEGK